MSKRPDFPGLPLPSEFEELLTFERTEVKNIDILYRYLNMVYSELVQKKELAEKNGDPQETAYIEGQITGFRFANSIIEAFFDH